MTRPLLLCTDLDRTLIPNGDTPESPDARPRFRRLVSHEWVTLVYVTGRHQGLVREAIAAYALPEPDLVVGDVGTSLFRISADGWEPMTAWQREFASDWGETSHAALAALFADIPELRLQTPEKQAPYKLSYHVPLDCDSRAVKARMQARLSDLGVRASLIWSIDEAAATGLLDVLPRSATKYHAVDFVMRHLGHVPSTTVFAGDSGNDLEVLTSPIPAILVANAHPEVRAEALQLAAAAGHSDRLYCARGGWSGMNGNYGAGILEGIAHFRPDLADALTA
jgi:sucrose-6F-phosphate phosphohydrolase